LVAAVREPTIVIDTNVELPAAVPRTILVPPPSIGITVIDVETDDEKLHVFGQLATVATLNVVAVTAQAKSCVMPSCASVAGEREHAETRPRLLTFPMKSARGLPVVIP